MIPYIVKLTTKSNFIKILNISFFCRVRKTVCHCKLIGPEKNHYLKKTVRGKSGGAFFCLPYSFLSSACFFVWVSLL